MFEKYVFIPNHALVALNSVWGTTPDETPLHNFLEKLTKRQQLRFDTFIPRGVDHAQSPMHQKRAIWKNKIFRTKQLSPSGKTQGESVLVKNKKTMSTAY